MRPVALVTGGTRGIGLGIAKELAAKGHDLILNGVREEIEVEPVLENLRSMEVEVCYAKGNIALEADRKGILETAKERFGKLNILVNNAGVAPKVRADVLEVTPEDFDELMDINLRGTFFLTQSLAQWMLEQKHTNPSDFFSIIHITSVSASMASINRAAYCISKAGLSMFSKLMAVRMAEKNIPVYEVRPGVIETDMTEKVKSSYEERIQNGLTLEKRMGLPYDVGRVVAALAKGDLPYATGQVISVDGGLTVERL
ncbi:3-ketoacyl-ACP reductase [Aquiflexum lacus]|uniref:3-ketoacyl-ACP reductase n=1 Tax=Aquiflexum lacus TaxID=2483805 RepID=UPI0018941771|nr:3-ketoacyl-ACP reductase [Aquiflexum lacus]